METTIYTHFEWVFKPKDRTTLVINIALLCMLILILILEWSKHTYKVKIEFCYGREPVIAEVRTLFYPSNREISTNREAMPRYEGYVNVRNVTVIDDLSK